MEILNLLSIFAEITYYTYYSNKLFNIKFKNILLISLYIYTLLFLFDKLNLDSIFVDLLEIIPYYNLHISKENIKLFLIIVKHVKKLLIVTLNITVIIIFIKIITFMIITIISFILMVFSFIAKIYNFIIDYIKNISNNSENIIENISDQKNNKNKYMVLELTDDCKNEIKESLNLNDRSLRLLLRIINKHNN